MYLRVVCLFLAAVVVSADDLMKENYITFMAIRPGSAYSSHDTLQMFMAYNAPDDMSYMDNLVLLVSKPGQDTIHHMLGLVNRTGVFKGKDEPKNYQVTGSKWDLYVLWDNADEGYCRSYMTRAFGVDANGKSHFVFKKIKVDSRDGSSCKKEQEVQTLENIQNSFPNANHEQQVQILNKLNSIDTNTYSVSNIYKGRVFIASMKDKNFQFHKMNELCKTAGGYLLELEDQDEQSAVRDFLKDIGSYNYYIGGNDVDSEGNFVYYNSKKPMINVVWAPGEPNNDGNEDCVEVAKNGLNDNQCGREHGYLCEIPLL